MKNYLMQIVSQQANDFMKRSMAREYLQARILEALQDRGAFLSGWRKFTGIGPCRMFLHSSRARKT
jgi:hypothetical protein